MSYMQRSSTPGLGIFGAVLTAAEGFVANYNVRRGAGMTGSANENVREVQFLLNAFGAKGNERSASGPLDTDGRFGPFTEAAVIAFQKANSLNSDGKGVVGPQTSKALQDSGSKNIGSGGSGSGRGSSGSNNGYYYAAGAFLFLVGVGAAVQHRRKARRPNPRRARRSHRRR